MGRKREHFKPLTVRIDKNQYKNIIRDSKRNGNVGNTLRRVIDEHYNYEKVFKLRIRNNLLGFYNLIYGGVIMNKKIIALIGIVAIAGMLFGLGLQPLAFTTTMTEDESIDGYMSVYHNGVLIYRDHNTLTDNGANGIRTCLSGAGTVANCNVSYIAVGNGSTPTSSTTLLDSEIFDCGLSRTDAHGSLDTQATGNWSLDNTFTSSCDDLVANTSAMYNSTAANGNVSFWASSFTSTTLQSSDTLKITWNVSVS